MIRSATQVTAEVLAAGTDLVVVGRAGIGLDNVDVAAATKRGVMVVNAPQSNVLSAAEQTVALMLAHGAQHPAGRRRPQGRASGTARAGRASSCTARRSASSGSAGSACSSRSGASSFGMRLVAYDPYVSADRARQLGVELEPDLERLVGDRRLPHDPPAEDPGDDRADRRRRCSRRRSRGLRIVNTARGGIVDEAVLADGDRATARSPAPRSTCSPTEPTTESPLFGLPNVVVTPHLGASTVEAQDKAGQTIAEQVVLALAGEFVPFAVNLAATEANSTVQPFLPLVERLGRLFTALAGGVVDTLEVGVRGPDRRLRLQGAHARGAEGRARPGRRRAGELRERAGDRARSAGSSCARRRSARRATT